MKRTLVVLSALVLLSSGGASAQSMDETYTTALGIKFWPGAISIKHFISGAGALEGLASFWDDGFRFTGLYEIHGDIGDAPGLKWYIGPGAHIGAYNGTSLHGHYYGSGDLSIGLDGVIGLDYKFNNAPINISVDLNPYLELAAHPYLDIWGGLGIRYTF